RSPACARKASVAAHDGDRVPLPGSYKEVAEPRLLVLGMDRPGGDDPSTMAMELDARDDYRTTIVLRQTCDTAEERDMAEQGSTLLLDSLATYLDQNATRS